MRICHLLPAVVVLVAMPMVCLAESPKPDTIHGKLVQRPGKPPALETTERLTIALDGDEPTRGVLNDTRLNGFEIEAKGHFTAPDRFQVCLLYTSPSPRDGLLSRMPSSA